jgi:hypothetical protein
MTNEEVTQVLIAIKACWQDQATDDVTIRWWCEMLRELPFRCAWDAIQDRIKAGLPRPSLAEVYRATADRAAIEAERLRASRKGLPAPDLSEEQRERNQQFLRDLVRRLGS